MFKNKIISVLMCAVLVSCTIALPVLAESVSDSAENTDLLPIDQSYDNSLSRELYTAECGNLQKFNTFASNLLYPHKTNIFYKGQDGYIIDRPVTSGEFVNEGDVLLVIQPVVDTVDLTEKQLELDRKNILLQNITDDYKTTRNRLLTEMSGLTDYDYAKKAIEIEQAKVRYEQNLYELELQIDEMTVELEKLEAALEPFEVIAPCSGKVQSITYYSDLDLVHENDFLMNISDLSVMFASCSYSDLHFGQEVTVNVAFNREDSIMNGTVVACNEILPVSISDFAYIQLDLSSNEDALAYISNPKVNDIINVKNVRASVATLGNVLLIPNKFYTTTNQITMVKVLDQNNKVHNRRIKIDLEGEDYTWVLLGLSEGDVLIKP